MAEFGRLFIWAVGDPCGGGLVVVALSRAVNDAGQTVLSGTKGVAAVLSSQ